MSRSMQVPYKAYVTASLQTDLFLVYIYIFCFFFGFFFGFFLLLLFFFVCVCVCVKEKHFRPRDAVTSIGFL